MTTQDNEKKIRILCLHGYKQNIEIMRNIMKRYIFHFGRYNIELDFMESDYNYNVLNKSNLKTLIYKKWWTENNLNRKKTNYDKITENEDNELVGSINKLKNEWEKGNYDCILGFDQGAILAQIFVSRMENEIEMLNIKKPKLMILFSVYYNDLTKNNIIKKIICPTIIIHGMNDTFISIDELSNIRNLFENNRLLIHHGGHYVSATKEIIYILRPIISNLYKSDVLFDQTE